MYQQHDQFPYIHLYPSNIKACICMKVYGKPIIASVWGLCNLKLPLLVYIPAECLIGILHIHVPMGDYRYTELSYKITSLISRTCCLCSSGLTYTQADAVVMPCICDSYRTITTKILSMHFNYLFLLLLISPETTTPHVRRCPFIFAVL